MQCCCCSAPGKQDYASPDEAYRLTRSRNAQPHAVILDTEGRIGRACTAKTTPHMFIIDAAGTLAYMGGIDSITSTNPEDIPGATQSIRVALRELAVGEPISTAATKPYVCSVKY